MKTQIKTIQPSEAAQILKKNGHNRPLIKRNLEYLKKQIIENKWKLTHQGICIDVNGNLMDGQHRLLACVETDTPIDLQITTDVEPDVFKVVDQGVTRSLASILATEGYRYYGELSTLVKQILHYERTGGLPRERPDIDEVLRYTKQNKDTLLDIVSIAKSVKKCSFISASRRAFLYYLLDKKGQTDYWSKLIEGTDNLIINNFRNELINDKIRKVHYADAMFHKKALHNCKCYLDNKKYRFKDRIFIKEFFDELNLKKNDG